MAAHPSNPALVNPMGRAAWWATVRAAAEWSATECLSALQHLGGVRVGGAAGGREEGGGGSAGRARTGACSASQAPRAPRDPRALFTLSVSRIASTAVWKRSSDQCCSIFPFDIFC